MKCFILEPTPRYSPDGVEEWGRLVYVYEQGECRTSIWADGFAAGVVQDMLAKGYDPETDFFVVTGAQAPVTMVAVELSVRFGDVNLLYYHGNRRSYVSLTDMENADATS